MALIPKILVISNLQTTSPLWVFNVTQQRWNVILETNPANTLQRWTETLPDLVVFDIDPGNLAIELITNLREEAVLPILLLTSLRSDQFMLDVYEAGVDECILKPLHPPLFHAKLKAWLRRFGSVPVDMLDALRVGNFHLVPSNRSLELDDRELIHLTNLEFRLLYYLMGRPRRTVTAKELCQHVWGHQSEGDAATLRNLIYRLRHKIEDDPAHPHYVRTVVGVGYQFTAN
jgi:DNA-binding response OmpR family regulator